MTIREKQGILLLLFFFKWFKFYASLFFYFLSQLYLEAAGTVESLSSPGREEFLPR